MTDGDAPVLVDSSLWIDYYHPAGRREWREEVLEALDGGRVATTPPILVEVLQGAPTEEELEALREDFAGLRWLPFDRGRAVSAARIGFALRRRGAPVPAVDLAIAAVAIASDGELWHRDAHFERIAEVAPLRQRRFG